MPFFPEEWIQDLLSKVDLVDLISGYVTLQNKSGRWWACCPFHNEKTPSFSVNPEKGFYHCFGCGKGGNAIQFVMEQEKMTFPEACQYLAERVKLPLPENSDDTGYEKRKQQRKRILEMNKIAARYFHQNLYSPDGKQALDYLQGRGITERTIKTFGMGFARNGWDHLMNLLAENGYTKQEMQAAGLIKLTDGKSYDMFRNRAMIPIINAFGDIIGFGGRVMDDGMPKYLNSPETAVFNKSRNLYNLNLIRRQKNLSHLILVEGYMDVIALFSYGIPECVATLGTALTQDQARLIKRYTNHVYISYDGDGAGQKATLRALGILTQEGIEPRVVVIPDGQDPDEYLRKQGRNGYIQLMKTSLPEMDYRFRNVEAKYDLSDGYQKEKFAQECAGILKSVDSAVTKEKYARKLSEITGFSQASILQDAGGTQKEVPKWIPPKAETGERTAEEKAEVCLVRRLYADPQFALKLDGKLSEEDFQKPANKKIFSYIMGKAKKGIFTANSELLSVLNEEEGVYLRKILSAEDAQEQTDEFMKGCVKQLRISRLVRQRKSLLAACGTETRPERKRDILQRIDELGKELHKLKNSF